jgi:hypothetical protein
LLARAGVLLDRDFAGQSIAPVPYVNRRHAADRVRFAGEIVTIAGVLPSTKRLARDTLEPVPS